MTSYYLEKKLYDFNCDIAQSFGVYNNDIEEEIAKYASSINIAAGFHAGDPVKIRKAFLFAKENNKAIGAHIGYPDIAGFGKRKMDLSDEESEAIVVYQIGAIIAYARTFDLEIEHVRCHGALKTAITENDNCALTVINAIKKVSPWLNLFVQSQHTKELAQNNGLKAALEFEFDGTSSIRQIRELENEQKIKFDTIHFRSTDDIQRAYDIVKPFPVNYNRVCDQI